MEKKLQYVTAAALGAAGAGAALALTRKAGQEKRQAAIRQVQAQSGYRNTERGKNHKNRKGIYYSSGNYEAFARPEKPAGVEEKQAWIVGSGLAALAAACFLVRDGQMPGDHIHILEAMDVAGGACDGIFDP
ncbi:MAG TPA: oleate hydratase, partial [Candidatus Faecousia faecipullorum]|nr:oleate hydratase [Candidatus Faecousia faecipullorum]